MEERYSRNIFVEGIGKEGQAKLKASKALVIGAGGLGSPVLYYLVAAGVGTIGIVDDDLVSITNLQRQILHFTDDIGRRKTDSAREKLEVLNPDVKIVTYSCRFTAENAEKIINGFELNEILLPPFKQSSENHSFDFVIDCCDNYATKLLINDICVQMKKPYSHGAVSDMQGEVMTYIPGSACYRCVFENLSEASALPTATQAGISGNSILPTATQAGILGPVAGIIGSIQATEAIKYLAGLNDLITNRILITDAKTMNFISLKVKKKSACLCG